MRMRMKMKLKSRNQNKKQWIKENQVQPNETASR